MVTGEIYTDVGTETALDDQVLRPPDRSRYLLLHAGEAQLGMDGAGSDLLSRTNSLRLARQDCGVNADSGSLARLNRPDGARSRGGAVIRITFSKKRREVFELLGVPASRR